MISVEEACKIALTKIPEDKKIIEVWETDRLWVFLDETFERPIIGPKPIAIFKKDGDFEYCHPAETNTMEYYFGKKKKIPFPDWLVKSGRAKTLGS